MKEIKPWNGKEAVVIDGHFDNPSKTWNGENDICKCGNPALPESEFCKDCV